MHGTLSVHPSLLSGEASFVHFLKISFYEDGFITTSQEPQVCVGANPGRIGDIFFMEVENFPHDVRSILNCQLTSP